MDDHTASYDTLIQTKELQILKAIVPYLGIAEQKQAGLFVQYLEMKQWNHYLKEPQKELSACGITKEQDRRTAMLSAIRKYCSPKEQETIDTLLNLLCIMDTYPMESVSEMR